MIVLAPLSTARRRFAPPRGRGRALVEVPVRPRRGSVLALTRSVGRGCAWGETSSQAQSPRRGPEPGSPLRLFSVTQTAAESPDRAFERGGKGVKAHPARGSDQGGEAALFAVLTRVACRFAFRGGAPIDARGGGGCERLPLPEIPCQARFLGRVTRSARASPSPRPRNRARHALSGRPPPRLIRDWRGGRRGRCPGIHAWADAGLRGRPGSEISRGHRACERGARRVRQHAP